MVMNKIQGVLRITRYQMVQLVRNPRLYMIVFCNFIFLSTFMVALRSFLRTYQLKATPFLFSFLFTHPSVLFSFLAGVIILFSNAPFFGQSQMFLVIRSGKLRWAVGQILYLIAGSVLYFLLLYGMSLLSLLPYISLENEWGSVWNTLARTGLGNDCGVTLTVSAKVLNVFTPMELLGWTFLMGILNSLLLGLVVFFCNVCFKREVGIIIAVLLILAPYRLSFMPTFFHYIVTSAWLDPAYLFFDPIYKGPNAVQQLLILCSFIIVLTAGCLYGIFHKDLPEVEE